MKKIFLAQYHFYDGSSSGIIDLKAFVDEDMARQFIHNCTAEAHRIAKEINQYWEKHKAEDERLMAAIRKKILAKEYDVKAPENRRRREILDGERAIIQSHKYHPDYNQNFDDDASYEISEIELVE